VDDGKLKKAIEGQYLAGLTMLRQCVERCPVEVWLAGTEHRPFWRIAYHAVFYAHLYLGQGLASFESWEKHRNCKNLWPEEDSDPEPYTQAEILEYIDLVEAKLGETIAGLDLETEDPGFDWYKGMAKLDHELMSFRHLQGHVGQLSELLMAHGIDTDWMGRRPR
jgi:hypothetical protein